MRAAAWFVAGFIFIMALTYGRELMLLAVGPIFLALRRDTKVEEIARASEQRGEQLDKQLLLLEASADAAEEAKRKEVVEWLDQ